MSKQVWKASASAARDCLSPYAQSGFQDGSQNSHSWLCLIEAQSLYNALKIVRGLKSLGAWWSSSVFGKKETAPFVKSAGQLLVLSMWLNSAATCSNTSATHSAKVLSSAGEKWSRPGADGLIFLSADIRSFLDRGCNWHVLVFMCSPYFSKNARADGSPFLWME